MARPIRCEAWLFAFLLLTQCEQKTETPAPTAAPPPPSAAAPAPAPTPSAAPSASETASASAAAAPSAAPAPDRTPPADAIKTKSGLAMVVLTKGTGKKHPKATDIVRARFTGWTPTGRPFGGNEPSLLTLSQEPPGWSEALIAMVEGEKRRVWMPPALAYGNAPGAPNEALVLDLELVAIVEPPKAPPDVKQPPKDATKLPSGLAYKILQKGTGTEHPTATSRVTMHYTGWTKAGKMFDSSVLRGAPLTIGLSQVIPGWTQGVPVMVVGDKMRLWIPAALAYGEKPPRPTDPAGDLVFDLELLAIR
jgi:peptidylprolyl isomerase